MTNEDPFADLGETLGEGPDDSENTGVTQETTESVANNVSAEEPINERDPMTDSAFTYEEANQRPFYAREETIEAFDSWLNYELERELSERGYQNIVVREMTDALLRTVVEEGLISEVVERFEKAREN